MEMKKYEAPVVVEIGTAADLTEGGSAPMIVDAFGDDDLGVPTS